MTFLTREDALAQWNRFVHRYYDGDDSTILCQVSRHTKGYVVSVYDRKGFFLTIL